MSLTNGVWRSTSVPIAERCAGPTMSSPSRVGDGGIGGVEGVVVHAQPGCGEAVLSLRAAPVKRAGGHDRSAHGERAGRRETGGVVNGLPGRWIAWSIDSGHRYMCDWSGNLRRNSRLICWGLQRCRKCSIRSWCASKGRYWTSFLPLRRSSRLIVDGDRPTSSAIARCARRGGGRRSRSAPVGTGTVC